MNRSGCPTCVVLVISFLIANPIRGQEPLGGPSPGMAPTGQPGLVKKALREGRGASDASQGDLVGALSDLLYQLGFVNWQVTVPPRNAMLAAVERREWKKAPLEEVIRGIVDAIDAPLRRPTGLHGLRQQLLHSAVNGQERSK